MRFCQKTKTHLSEFSYSILCGIFIISHHFHFYNPQSALFFCLLVCNNEKAIAECDDEQEHKVTIAIGLSDL